MSEQIDNSIMALARQQIFDEYIKKKSSELSDWLLECDRVWKEEGTLLPYPSFSVYPNEEDVITRAKLLSKSTEEPEVEEETVKEEIAEESVLPLQQNTVPVFYKKHRKWKK